MTSLPQAITKGHEEIALILIEAGADVAAKNKVSQSVAISLYHVLSSHMLPYLTKYYLISSCIALSHLTIMKPPFYSLILPARHISSPPGR